jgi:NAD(P)-dependent dehydrogenase (short-subunit alcohol dehydrogenase family)
MTIGGMTFVITGAARGIGAETARLAAELGANVVVSDILVDEGTETAASIRAAGGAATFERADVTDEASVTHLMTRAAETFGGIDVLHNNAGIHETMVSSEFTFETMSIDTFDRVMAVNVRGAVLCAQQAFPYLRESSRNPSIINAGSTASFAGYPFGLAYGTSKGAIAQMTKNLAVALAPYGIRSNCYCPASVDTQMVTDVTANIHAALDPAAAAAAQEPITNDAQLGAHLVRRIGTPRDIAELVCFLAQATFVNGVTWLIDGGVLAWRDTVDALGME